MEPSDDVIVAAREQGATAFRMAEVAWHREYPWVEELGKKL